MKDEDNKPGGDDLDNTDDQDQNKSGGGDESRDDKADGRTFTQDQVDNLISKRLRQEKDRIKREVTDSIRDEVREEIEADAAKESGDFKKALEREQRKVKTLEDKIAQMERDDAEAKLETARIKIATDEGLPKWAYDRIKGETEDELKADAKRLAESLGVNDAPDGDLGKSNNSSGSRRNRRRDDEIPAYEDPGFWNTDL